MTRKFKRTVLVTLCYGDVVSYTLLHLCTNNSKLYILTVLQVTNARLKANTNCIIYSNYILSTM